MKATGEEVQGFPRSRGKCPKDKGGAFPPLFAQQKGDASSGARRRGVIPSPKRDTPTDANPLSRSAGEG